MKAFLIAKRIAKQLQGDKKYLALSIIVTIQRMCFTCSNYQHEKGIHYCKLLKSQLDEHELRIDCPEHELQVLV